jgi:hypothetical protein
LTTFFVCGSYVRSYARLTVDVSELPLVSASPALAVTVQILGGAGGA